MAALPAAAFRFAAMQAKSVSKHTFPLKPSITVLLMCVKLAKKKTKTNVPAEIRQNESIPQ
jgi:hypothetical protein